MSSIYDLYQLFMVYTHSGMIYTRFKNCDDWGMADHRFTHVKTVILTLRRMMITTIISTLLTLTTTLLARMITPIRYSLNDTSSL